MEKIICGRYRFLLSWKVVYMVLTKTEIFSRVCGYLRPVSNWNDAKQEEFSDRTMYDKSSDIYKVSN